MASLEACFAESYRKRVVISVVDIEPEMCVNVTDEQASGGLDNVEWYVSFYLHQLVLRDADMKRKKGECINNL